LRGKFHPEILRGSPSGASNKGGVDKISIFSIFKREYLENGIADTAEVTIND